MQNQDKSNTVTQQDGLRLSRRNFLKSTLAFGTAMAVAPVLKIAQATQRPVATGEASTSNITTKRTLGHGNYAMEVSALGFGVMGMNYNRGAHPDKPALIRLLHEAVDRGVTLFDTAEIYGPFINEELAGEALSPYKNKVFVTTKFGHEIINGKPTGGLDSRPEHIKLVCEQSLKRLKIDSIGLFYQHRADPSVPIEDVAGAVADLIKEGKVRHFGLCEVSAQTIQRAHAVQPVTAVQSEYSLMWREPEQKILPLLEKLRIGFVPYSPLCRGFLGGDLNEYTEFSQTNDNRNILPRFTPEAMRANLALVEILHAFGRSRGMTAAQIALAWMLAKKPYMVPIPGTTKLSHLEENLRTLDFKLSRKDLAELETAVSKIKIIGDRYPASEQKKVGQ